MNRKKVLALTAGLVILAGAAVPGTLAVEADSASAAGTVVVDAGASEESADASEGVANFAAAAAAAVQSEDAQAASASDSDGSGTGSTQDGTASEGTSVETAAEGATGASGAASTEFASDAANVTESVTDNTTGSTNSSDITDTTNGTAGEASDKASDKTADKTSDKTTADSAADGVTGKKADTAKKAAETKTCTCGAAEGAAHQEGCPLYVSAESFQHKDGCSDECSDKDCTCGCHLYDRIMACDNIDDLWILIDNADDASIELLTDEQNEAIDAKIEELEPEPEPAIVIEESDEIVPSEIGYEYISFTDVAPLGDPVTGGDE